MFDKNSTTQIKEGLITKIEAERWADEIWGEEENVEEYKDAIPKQKYNKLKKFEGKLFRFESKLKLPKNYSNFSGETGANGNASNVPAFMIQTMGCITI